MANGAPTVSNGLVISGVTTSTTFSGSGASLTNLPSAQLTGALPAIDGSNLTGLAADKIFEGNTEVEVVDTGSDGHVKFTTEGTEKARIDSSGRVLIGSTAKAGDSLLQVYTSDQLHPAIRTNSPNSNGYTMFGDAYAAGESQVNMGIAYSSASLVLSVGCKVNTSNDDAYVSSQGTYSTRPTVLRLDTDGSLLFLNNASTSTTPTDNAVTLTRRFKIDSSGQVRAGDECNSDRTGYRHQFSSTAGSGDVLSIQNPSNTDGQGIGLGFWARNTNNAAIEVAKIKAVAEETQANSTQKGSLRFLTNKEASLVESMRLTNSGNVTIYGRTHSNQGTSSGNVPLQIVGGGNNVVTMFLGNGNTAGNGVNDYSADIRFNGAAVAWGDLSYYPTGDSNGGAFRFTGNGSTVASQGNRSLGCSGVFINGTSQNQHLDDYEEGDYTPNVQTDNGVNCGMSAAQGYYVKVGKIVTVHLRLATNSHNSVNTTAQYKVSLPFTSQAQGDTQGTLMCSVWSIGSSNISWMGGQVHNNNAWTHLAYHNGNNNNTNHLQPNVANNQLSLRGTVVYRSDS